MRGNPGTIVSWTDGETTRYGIIYVKKQSAALKGRLVVSEIHDLVNFQPILTDGKQSVIIKLPQDLKACGKVD